MSISDTHEIEALILEITDIFADKMKQVFDEVPEIFEGCSTKLEWVAQCNVASDELENRITIAIGEIERLLHDGQFFSTAGWRQKSGS